MEPEYDMKNLEPGSVIRAEVRYSDSRTEIHVLRYDGTDFYIANPRKSNFGQKFSVYLNGRTVSNLGLLFVFPKNEWVEFSRVCKVLSRRD